MKITFFHLDLGVGGAERLIVDAACALKVQGHDIILATSHHDFDHCFEETMPALAEEMKAKDQVNISEDIRCAGDWLPRDLRGRFTLFFAVIRMIYISYRFSKVQNPPDLFIVDQVSFVIPFLRIWSPATPILFYCHFPDKLLAPASTSKLQKLYRYFFDYAEEVTTAAADKIVVNSNYTADVVSRHFTKVTEKHALTVLYPCVDIQKFDNIDESQYIFGDGYKTKLRKSLEILQNSPFVLSINRFERKKGIDKAIRALKFVINKESFLVIAGGYDERVMENVAHRKELEEIAKSENVLEKVIFVENCTHNEKLFLLKHCRALVYTPIGEHFGIVPIETGAAKKPCIACNSGGPKESILHEVTGLLVEPTPESFATAMNMFLDKEHGEIASKEYGDRAYKRVVNNFSRQAFGKNLDQICKEVYLIKPSYKPAILFYTIFTLIFSFVLFYISIFYRSLSFHKKV